MISSKMSWKNLGLSLRELSGHQARSTCVIEEEQEKSEREKRREKHTDKKWKKHTEWENDKERERD